MPTTFTANWCATLLSGRNEQGPKSSIIIAATLALVPQLTWYVMVHKSGSKIAPGMPLQILKHSLPKAHWHRILSLSGSMTTKRIL